MKKIFIIIYILLIIGWVIIPFAISSILEEIFEDEELKSERDISRGCLTLLLNG